MGAGQSLFLERHLSALRLLKQVAEPLTEAQMRARPSPQVNSVAWIVWHLARTEDYGMNRAVAARPQVLDDGWVSKLGVGIKHQGTGMDDDEVSDFCSVVRLDGLWRYVDAVGSRTREIVEGLSDADLERAPDDAHLRKVLIEEGNFKREVGEQVFKDRQGKPIWWWLGQRITHHYIHLGEAITVRSLLGIKSLV